MEARGHRVRPEEEEQALSTQGSREEGWSPRREVLGGGRELVGEEERGQGVGGSS